MMGIQIFIGNLWSFLVFKEWEGVPKNARALQILALAVLVMASVLIGGSMGFVS
jgi:glucose uptake protein GlcU